MIDMKELTPKRMVEIFDRYVYGQQEAKAILAVAMRNRWRLCRLAQDVRLAVIKQNILLHGPTGSGKTALLRVLKNHFGLPVHEVDITEYTETGYVGKEVGTIIKDLFSLEIPVPDWYKKEWAERDARDKLAQAEKIKDEPVAAKEPAPEQENTSPFVGYYVKLLLALVRVKLYPNEASGLSQEQRRAVVNEALGMLMVEDQANRTESLALLNSDYRKKISRAGMNIICNRGTGGVMTANITSGARDSYSAERGWLPRFEVPEDAPNMSDVFEDLHQKLKEESTDAKRAKALLRAGAVSSRIYELRGIGPGAASWNNPGSLSGNLSFLSEDLRARLMNNPALAAAFGNIAGGGGRVTDETWRERFIQDYGVVFVDEIDKLAESNDSSGKDRVSRTGVQRSLLKALEGEDGHRYNTLNVLWIAAGSFANQPISRLMPELQGRLPLRAAIKPLDKSSYVQILKLPTSVFHSSVELLGVEGVKVIYDDATFEVIAEACEVVNEGTSHLGARRLGDLAGELFLPAMYEPDTYLESGYDITGEKAKWLIERAHQNVKIYKDSLADFAKKETQGR